MRDVSSRAARRHGHAGSTEHRTWKNIVQRCTNPRCPAFPGYGGRGIRLCVRWRESFESFLADMGPRPSPDHSVDRIDNDGNYEPGNCRWATRAEQRRNTSTNIMLECEGRTMTLADWADHFGLRRVTVYARYHRGDRGGRLFRQPSEAPRWRTRQVADKSPGLSPT